MFQHLHDLDHGDVPQPLVTPTAATAALPPSAAHHASIGPSTHTNPLMTLQFQMKAVHADSQKLSQQAMRDLLTQRHGFALWTGPSQAPVGDHIVGVYVRGHVPPGTVVVRRGRVLGD